MGSVKKIANHFKQYTMVAAGALGLTGGRAPYGPLRAQIGISDPCNHRCVFCWDHPPDDHESADTADRFGGGRPGVMSLQQFQEIVDDLYALGTRRIDLVGRGEPLTNRHALTMIRYAKKHEMQLLMVTNGSRLSERIAKGIVEAPVDRVNISLNAGTPETYPHIHVTETPDNYLKVKKNLRFLSDAKIAAGSDLPYLNLNFVINAKNYFEIAKMVEVAHEVGAQDAQFVHAVLHDGTADLAMNESQYRAFHESLPAARERAAALGVESNLEALAASTPPYMPSQMVGPTVVPCYVGWYYTNILGNGSVMPCCQCASPVGQLTKERRFADIWASPEYAEFRTAARSLPEKSPRLMTCECDNCQLRPRNLAIHNFLHPLNRIQAGGEVQRFTPRDFLRKMRGRYGESPGFDTASAMRESATRAPNATPGSSQ
jgi:MoaA/NifB/PqqE/SkfB family radical SAM enzyme